MTKGTRQDKAAMRQAEHIEAHRTEPEEAFSDPVLRCDSCTRLVKATQLRKVGACPLCGNKRMRNVTVFDDAERKQLLSWDMRSFVAEFEPQPDE